MPGDSRPAPPCIVRRDCGIFLVPFERPNGHEKAQHTAYQPPLASEDALPYRHTSCPNCADCAKEVS